MWRVTRTGSPEVLRVCESSPDSAETSFRELDDVFLQTQTRIWLGEVLHVRFDEDVGITDLLADGELLFQVSKEVWKMLLRKHGELKHSKVLIFERASSGRSEGRYMPYPKVDSFLKICQLLGLTGIDLFSPSDVVEKRDIRRVCMCIRSFSKKARSKKLNVPDFDVVTYTIAMPTHLVGGIRRNLELSWCSPPSFSESSPWNDAREICGLRSQHSDSRSDESERNFSDLEFESPFSSASYDSTNITYIVEETTPESSPNADDFVHETSFNSRVKDSNHYEVLHEHQEEMFAESAYSCHFSTTETYALQDLSSSSYYEYPTDEDTSICLSDIGKGSADSSLKVVKNGLKLEDLAGTLYLETSYQAYMNSSFLNVAPSEGNQNSQFSSPSNFSRLEVHSNFEVQPCNTIQKCSFFKNAIASNNKVMKDNLYYIETSDDSHSIPPESYSLDNEAGGNYGISLSEINSPSLHNLNSSDNYVFNSELKASYSTIVSRNVYSLFSSFTDKQNKLSRSLADHPFERNQNERNQNESAHTSLSSVENDCPLLSHSNDPNYLAKRRCCSQSTNPLINCFTESESECSSSSSMCLTCNGVNIEDGSYLVTNNCMQESDVYKTNFMTDLNEDFINTLVPAVQDDVNIAAHSLSLEGEKYCNVATHRIFEMSGSLSSRTEMRSNIENAGQVDASCQSCQTQENPQVVVEGNLSEELCLHYNFLISDYVKENKMSKCALEIIENNGSSSNYTQGKDSGCICGSTVDESSISGLPCIVSTISEQGRNPERENLERTDGLFYYGVSSVDDSDCSDVLKMHQSSHDASDIAFLLSKYESKITPSKKGRAGNVADEESSVNQESCQYGNGKTRDFGHLMTKNSNLFYTKDLDVLDVMESSDFASSTCVSEMIPTFDFCRYDLFQSHSLETKGETFQTVYTLPSSSSACIEGKEVASNESIQVEKHVVSCIHDAFAEPNNLPHAILDTIDECGKSKDKEGRTLGKSGNQVLKSVAGEMTVVGTFVLFLHVRQNKDKEKKNEMGMRFRIQKPNQEFFTKRKTKIGKSDSLYPGEKLKF